MPAPRISTCGDVPAPAAEIGPKAEAASSMFMHTAADDKVCSHSGILGWGAAREMTAITTGARKKRDS